MQNETKKQVINYLFRLGKGQIDPVSRKHGICYSLEILFGVDYFDLVDLTARWELFSDDITYPVPSPNKKISSAEYYHRTKDVWIGRYGKLRKELCLFLADQLEKELNENSVSES